MVENLIGSIRIDDRTQLIVTSTKWRNRKAVELQYVNMVRDGVTGREMIVPTMKTFTIPLEILNDVTSLLNKVKDSSSQSSRVVSARKDKAI